MICPLTSPDLTSMRSQMASAFSRGADAVEWRLDFLEQAPTPEQLRVSFSNCPERIIATCRPQDEGGRFKGSEAQRLEILREAAKLGVLVDVEYRVAPQARPDAKGIILSVHDFNRCPDPEDLNAVVAGLDASDAAINKIAFMTGACEDAFGAFDVIRACRKPTLALAMGETGVMTRILAGKFGAFGTFAALETGAGSAPGQPTLDEFKNLYRWDSVGPKTAVYGVIGSPVAHSMSPAIHNAAFTAADLDAVYVPLRIEPGAENFNRFMDALLARPWMDWRGISVTIPHKENALAYVGADNCDELANKIGAINTITIDSEGNLRGDNVDYAAAVDALCATMGIERQGLGGKSVAVVGAGGVARAIVAALAHYGADVTVFNRTVSRAEKLASEFDCRAAGLDAACASDADILINCTSVGMHPNVDAAPLERIPPSVKVVFDTIYNPVKTKLLRRALEAGCMTVTGLEMFVNQAVSQFEIWTGRPAPRDVMRDVVIRRLAE